MDDTEQMEIDVDSTDDRDKEPFDRIPPELTSRIFEFLDLPSKLNVRLVNHRLRQLMDDFDLVPPNYNFCALLNDESINHFINSTHTIKSVILRDLTKEIPAGSLIARKQLPPTNAIYIEKNVSGHNIFTLLDFGAEFADTLTIEAKAFENLGEYQLKMAGTKWEALTKLEITVHHSYEPNDLEGVTNHNQSLTAFLKDVNMSCLKSLLVNLITINTCPIHDHGTKYDIPIEPVFGAFYGFIGRHARTIETLQFALNAPNVPIPNITFQISDELRTHILQNLTLKRLDVQLPQRGRLSKLVHPCLLESKQLNNLTWSSCMPRDGAQLEALIAQNSATLTKLKIRSEIFNSSWLKNCSVLRNLTINKNGTLRPSMSPTPSVTILDIEPVEANHFVYWIFSSFWNVEVIRICTAFLPLNITPFKILLNLTRLWKLRICYHGHQSVEAFREFCLENPEWSYSESEEIPGVLTVERAQRTTAIHQYRLTNPSQLEGWNSSTMKYIWKITRKD